MSDLVIISMHEKGFPSADFYLGGGDIPGEDFERMAPEPDGFFTMKRGETLLAAYEKAQSKWPSALILIAEAPEDDEDEESTAPGQ